MSFIRETKNEDATGELEEICFFMYPVKDRHGEKLIQRHALFQALRIAVNDELRVLKIPIPNLLPYLSEGGVLAIIQFHSLSRRSHREAYV